MKALLLTGTIVCLATYWVALVVLAVTVPAAVLGLNILNAGMFGGLLFGEAYSRRRGGN